MIPLVVMMATSVLAAALALWCFKLQRIVRTARVQLAEQGASLRDLSTALSDELSPVLASACTRIGLLEMGVHGEISQPQRDALRGARLVIQDAEHALVHLKATLGSSAQISEVEVSALIQECAETHGRQLSAAEQHLQLRQPGVVPRISMDPAAFRRVLDILLSRASRLAGQGDTIHVDVRLAGSSPVSGTGIWLAVSIWVASLAPGKAARAVELESETDLDLSSARVIATRLRGCLTVEADISHRSTLWLPVAPP